MNITFETRINAVKTYLKSEVSLRETASNLKIPYQTIHRWITWFREAGEENLRRKKPYKKPWNKTKKESEKKIALLKEKEPTLTVRKAKEILGKEGIKISIKGIWGIWKRYGYAGLKKEVSNVPTENISETPGSLVQIAKTEKMLRNGDIKGAARILNALPACHREDLLKEIPDELLSLRRRAEKLPSFFGEISFKDFRKRARSLRQQLEKNGFFYSALRIGIGELFTLHWLGNLEEQLSLCAHLKPWILKIRDSALCFTFFNLEGHAYGRLMRVSEALICAKRCRGLARTIPFTTLAGELGTLYSSFGYYKQALYWIEKSLKDPHKYAGILSAYQSYLLSLAGEYRKALRVLKEAEKKKKGLYSQTEMARALCFLGQGRIYDASQSIQKVLTESRKEKIPDYLHAATLVLASIYASLGEEKKARRFLKKSVKILEKFRIYRDLLFIQIVLEDTGTEMSELAPIHRLALKLRKATNTLSTRDYQKAYAYAVSQKLIGFFHRLVLFFPDPVKKLLEKGKPTKLPRALLRLPVFNKETPVYYIKFLGNLIVHKNQKYLRARLQPKDAAFLIHLALKAGEPEKKIPLTNLYRNFWANSLNPSRNLSHLLVKIKKTLKIPAYLLEISYKTDSPVLINRGIYFITDCDEFLQTLTQANAFQKAGEWSFAKREFFRAFSLWKGEPFERMYDFWSGDIRIMILNKFEKEVIKFVDECETHKDYKTAMRILEKADKIIKHSEKIKEMKKNLDLSHCNLLS